MIGRTGSDGLFRCPRCADVQPNAPRVFRWFGLFAGRRGGKTLIGAHGAREEIVVPNTLGWVCGPTYKILHDATMPTFLKLIPREWCANWDQENLELTLKNGSQVQFRSLDDPDRGHAGVGVHWAWFDEAAFIAELAWDYFRPALADFGGAAFFTSSVDGYDWTYERIEKPALVDKKRFFWAAKWQTIENPFIAINRPEEVAEARATMTPQLFRQEFEGERENFTGSVYGEWIDESWLADDEAVQKWIPEWPDVSKYRQLRGLDSGADHPFGAVNAVVTPKGIVIVGDYLERQRAFSTHLASIQHQFAVGESVMWSANRNEAQLRLELANHGILVAPAENDVMAGIQRVLSWLYTGQLKIAYTAGRTFEQMKKYRYAPNLLSDGQKTKEKVFKLKDELPDCVRYLLMTWPTLPAQVVLATGRDISKLSERSQWEIMKLREFNKSKDGHELTPVDKEYPIGEFFNNDVSEDMFQWGGN